MIKKTRQKILLLSIMLLTLNSFVFADNDFVYLSRDFDTEEYILINIHSTFQNVEKNGSSTITIKTSIPFEDINELGYFTGGDIKNGTPANVLQSCSYNKASRKTITCDISGLNGSIDMDNLKIAFNKRKIATLKNKKIKISYDINGNTSEAYSVDLSTNIDYAKAIQKADITVEDLDGNGTSNKNSGGKNGVGTNDKLIPNSAKNTSGSNSSGNGNNNTSGNSNSNTDGKNNSGNSDDKDTKNDKDNDSDKHNKEVLTDDDRGSWFL